MRTTCKTVRLGVPFLLLGILGAATHAAAAPPICRADEIPCPPTGLCLITGTYQVLPLPCALDFGDRPVELRGTLDAAATGESFEIRAGGLTLNGGRLRALGDEADSGGDITVSVDGPFTMTGAGPEIDVSGPAGGGEVDVTAAKIEILAGSIAADGGTGAECGGGGGWISLTADGALIVDGVLTATTGPGASCGGGSVSLEGANVHISKSVSVAGGDSGGDAQIAVVANSGDISLASTGSLLASGRGMVDDGEGGRSGVDGGGISLVTHAGNITLAGSVEASGSAPSGSGGEVHTNCNGTVFVSRPISVDGRGGESEGGDVKLLAVRGIVIDANVTASGGSDGSGGTIDLSSDGPVDVRAGAAVDVSGGSSRGGGTVEVSGTSRTGRVTQLTVSGTIRARGANGGSGGWVDLSAVDLTVGGLLDAGASEGGAGGAVSLLGCHIRLLATASIQALPCSGSEPCVRFVVPPGHLSVDPRAVVDPPASETWYPHLNLCCGDGAIDADLGEQCEDGAALSCDGCSKDCRLEAPDPCADDQNPCTGTTCIPEIGCEPLTGNACPDDGDPCTDDVCSYGACTHPSPCRDTGQDPCRTGTCDPATGCHFENLADGTACSVNACSSTCRDGACVNPCDDGSPCTVDRCYGFRRVGCENWEDPALCPSCSTDAGPLPAGTPCTDGNQCTHPDTCDGVGTCAAGAICDDGDPCTAGSCPSPGQPCWFFSDTSCPGTPWTESCAGFPDGTPCSDNNACTTGTCQGGACISTEITCGDAEACDGVWMCDRLFGCLRDPAPDTCADDGNACTADVCDSALGCLHEPLSGTHCADDGDLCTDDVCDDGTCKHPLIDCNDGDACTSDSCDPAGGCRHDPIDCDDDNPCTADSCDPASGCVHTPSCRLDHFQCYRATTTPGTPRFEPIPGLPLEDELGATSVDVKKPATLCLPASKRGEAPTAPSHEDHLAGYRIKTAAGAPPFSRQAGLRVVNQLGTLSLDLVARDRLLLPSAKSLTSPPGQPGAPNPDHFECYRLKVTKGTPGFQPISGVPIEDQRGSASVNIKKPTRLCNPANKNGEDAGAPGHPEHLLCYAIARSPGSPKFVKHSPVYVSNQFGQQTLDLRAVRELCVPSTIEAP